MDAAGIDAGNGCVKLEHDGVAHVDVAVAGQFHAEFGYVVGVNALQFLDLVEFAFIQFLALGGRFVPLLEQLGQALGAFGFLLGLLLLFLDLGIGLAVAKADGVCHLLESVCGIGAQVGHRHDDGVGLDHGRVGDPVEQRVVVLGALHAVPVALVLGGTQHLH